MEKSVFSENLLEMPGRKILEGGSASQETVFVIPEHLPPSGAEDDITHLWRVEIWGKVAGRPGFMHPFDLETAPAPVGEPPISQPS